MDLMDDVQVAFLAAASSLSERQRQPSTSDRERQDVIGLRAWHILKEMKRARVNWAVAQRAEAPEQP